MKPFMQWKSSKYYICFWVCICSRRYPVCNAHASYCRLWPVTLCRNFSALSHQRHDFRERENSCWTRSACFDTLHNFCL